MNKDRMLVALVLADVLLAFSVIGAELFFHWTLPGSLRDYTMSQMFSEPSVWGFGLLMLWCMSISFTLVAWIGLLNYWHFARQLYLAAWGTWVLLILLSGPSVMTPVGAMLSTLESVIAGALIGLVYFSDLARHFERSPVRVPSTA
jgi:hypothetical protein